MFMILFQQHTIASSLLLLMLNTRLRTTAPSFFHPWQPTAPLVLSTGPLPWISRHRHLQHCCLRRRWCHHRHHCPRHHRLLTAPSFALQLAPSQAPLFASLLTLSSMPSPSAAASPAITAALQPLPPREKHCPPPSAVPSQACTTFTPVLALLPSRPLASSSAFLLASLPRHH